MSRRRGRADRSRYSGPLVSPETRDDPRLLVQTLRSLRREGWSYQRIGDLLFPDRTYDARRRKVYKMLNRERVSAWNASSARRHRAHSTERTLARRRERAALCTRCGQPLSRPTAKPPCAACRSELYDERLARLVEAWNAGEATRSIAERLQINPRSITPMIAEARRRGYDAVHRRPGRSVIVTATDKPTSGEP